MSELDTQAREVARLRRRGVVFNQQPMETEMAKEKEKGNTKGELNRHKAMAMGKEIELKKGGKAEKETKKEDRKEKGKEEKKKAKK